MHTPPVAAGPLMVLMVVQEELDLMPRQLNCAELEELVVAVVFQPQAAQVVLVVFLAGAEAVEEVEPLSADAAGMAVTVAALWSHFSDMHLNRSARTFTQDPSITLDQLGPGWEECSIDTFNNWLAEGNVADQFIPSPTFITRRQLFLWLYTNHGITREWLRTQISDPVALIEFDEALDFDRTRSLVQALAAQLGLDVEQSWREASLL